MAAVVKWENSVVRARASNPAKRERWYPVTYSCGHTVELRAHDARKAEAGTTACCAACQSSAAGKVGFRVTVSKYGRFPLMQKIQQQQRENPSSLERVVFAWLESLSVEFEAQVILERGEDRYWLVDALLPGNVVIEVNGAWVHEQRQDADARKRAWLADNGYTLIDIPEWACTPELLTHLYGALVG